MSFMIDFEQYAVIGDPIQHSISPFLHKIVFDYFGDKNKIYSKLKITSDGLVYNFSLLKSNFRGFNVTAPHKSNIIKYLDELDDFSKKVGSVNTVKVIGGKSYGFNTDGYGFLKGLGDLKDDVKGKSILVLGSGAVSKVVVNTLCSLNSKVVVSARDFEKLMSIKQFASSVCDGYELDIIPFDKVRGEYFGIINATGTLSSFSGFNFSDLSVSDFAYDLNYDKDGMTSFLCEFQNSNIKTIDGSDMLFYQGIKSQEIWRNKTIEEEDVKELYELFKKFLVEA